MTPQERANELIAKFSNIYPDNNWIDLAINSINNLLESSSDSNFIEYWSNVKNIIIKRK